MTCKAIGSDRCFAADMLARCKAPQTIRVKGSVAKYADRHAVLDPRKSLASGTNIAGGLVLWAPGSDGGGMEVGICPDGGGTRRREVCKVW